MEILTANFAYTNKIGFSHLIGLLTQIKSISIYMNDEFVYHCLKLSAELL